MNMLNKFKDITSKCVDQLAINCSNLIKVFSLRFENAAALNIRCPSGSTQLI